MPYLASPAAWGSPEGSRLLLCPNAFSSKHLTSSVSALGHVAQASCPHSPEPSSSVAGISALWVLLCQSRTHLTLSKFQL